MLTVGIDIGTSYSSIAVLNEKTGEAEPVKVSNGICPYGDNYSFPSAVLVENDKLVLGQLAINKRLTAPACFKGEFKRDIGQDAPYRLGNLELLPEDLYKELFVYFKACAEEATGERIAKAYITYPANYSKRKKQFIAEAAKKAGLLNVELLDEPSAAAFCYFAKNRIQDGETLLVYDYGGGTFDTALLKCENGGFRLLTDSIGLEHCGGIDIDNEILNDILNKLMQEVPTVLEGLKQNQLAYTRTMAKLMEQAIQIKHQLSSVEMAVETIPLSMFDVVNYELCREDFHRMLAPYVEETLEQVRCIIRQAGKNISDIDHVLLVGGTSRIPYVRQRLEELTGKELRTDIDPELAICKGAAINKQENLSKTWFEIGDGFFLGNDGTAVDYEKAVYWFTKAAEQENGNAQFKLGVCYSNGQGVTQNYEKAAYWYTKAAEQGILGAQANLAVFYLEGKGVEQNDEKAVHWCTKVAEQGQADAQFALGNFYLSGSDVIQDYEKAVYWFIQAAEQGGVDAQNNLGVCYENGRGITQNYEKAVYWYAKAAEQGYAAAQYNLGVCYESGCGITQNYEKAVYWFTKAAEQEYVTAQYNLGVCYENGRGITQNYEEAFYWYTKSAEQGYAGAQNNLGLCYKKGQGVEQNYEKAHYWYTKAAEQGRSSAQNNLGSLYYYGYGVAKDYDRAGELWEKAAKQGQENAINNLKLLRKNLFGHYVKR